jgi:hypothetical protein
MSHNIGTYNTQKNALILKEYGRNIQMLAKYLNTIEDREKRSQSAKALIELMKQINPNVRDTNEESQKLWDDLFIMSDFELEIDSPYPKPERSILDRKPERIKYKDKSIMYKHYGLNIQLLVDKIVTIEDKKERDQASLYLGRLIKSFSNIWNRENLDDDSVMENIEHLSKGELNIDMDKVRENNLFDSLTKEKQRNNANGQDSRDSRHSQHNSHQQHNQHRDHRDQRHHRKGKRKRT